MRKLLPEPRSWRFGIVQMAPKPLFRPSEGPVQALRTVSNRFRVVHSMRSNGIFGQVDGHDLVISPGLADTKGRISLFHWL